jgi:hypothetical protein
MTEAEDGICQLVSSSAVKYPFQWKCVEADTFTNIALPGRANAGFEKSSDNGLTTDDDFVVVEGMLVKYGKKTLIVATSLGPASGNGR